MGAFKDLAIEIEERVAHIRNHLSRPRLSQKEMGAVKEKIDHCTHEMEKIAHDIWITQIKQAPPTPKPTYRYKRHKMTKSGS